MTGTDPGSQGAGAVRAHLGLDGGIRAAYTATPAPVLEVAGHPARPLPAGLVAVDGMPAPTVAELIASAHAADLLADGDLNLLESRLPGTMRDGWGGQPDRARAVAVDVLDWTCAPLTEPALLARLCRDGGSTVDAAEDYASQVSSPIRVLAADLPGLVAIIHDPVPGAVGARVRAGLGDTLAALVPALALGRDTSIPDGWACVRCGSRLLGWCRLDDGAASLVEIVRNQAWRVLTVRQVAAALTSFALRLDGAHAEWFARRTHTDQELTRAIRTMLRAGRPASRLPRLLRELAFAQADAQPLDLRVARAVDAV